MQQRSVCRNILQCFGEPVLGDKPVLIIYAIVLSSCFYGLCFSQKVNSLLMYVTLALYLFLLQYWKLHDENKDPMILSVELLRDLESHSIWK